MTLATYTSSKVYRARARGDAHLMPAAGRTNMSQRQTVPFAGKRERLICLHV